jgi:hypothetical protein
VGVGQLPAAADDVLRAMAEQLRKARPVGLCRFALTFRQQKKGGDWTHNAVNTQGHDVLYVSRLMRTYDDAGANFYLTRLLWSLRCTPHFARLQPWWLVFVPRSSLAKAMWAHGARAMKLEDFQNEVMCKRQCKPNKHDRWRFWGGGTPYADLKFERNYELTHVITAAGAELPEEAGKVYFWNRYKSKLSEGTTKWQEDGPLRLPPGLKVKMKDLSVNREFLHDALKEKSPLSGVTNPLLNQLRTG